MGRLQCFTQAAFCSPCIPSDTEQEVQGVSF
jgi:hypothetical protein